MINSFHAYLVKGFVSACIAVCAVAGPAAAMPVVPSSAQVGDTLIHGWAMTVRVIVVSVPTDFTQST